MIQEYFTLAIKNLRTRGLRSWLTMLGIFISVATIFMLISLSLGLQGAVKEQFELLGTDKIFIQSSTGFLGPPGSIENVILSEEDVEEVSKVRGVKDYSYFVAGNAKVEFGKNTRYMLVLGIPPESQNVFLEIGAMDLAEGRFLKNNDKNSVVLGNHFLTQDIMGKPIRAGNKIVINKQEFKVRGVMELIGNPDDDRAIMMDLDSFRKLFDIPNRVDYIMIQIEENEDVLEVAERVEHDLRKSRGVTEDTQDFDVFTMDELLESFQNILNIITAFLAGVKYNVYFCFREDKRNWNHESCWCKKFRYYVDIFD